MGLVTTTLKLILWMVAALLGLTVVSLGLATLLGWILVNRLLGRKPAVTLGGRFQDLRQFGAGFGASGFRAGTFWPRQGSASGTAAPDAEVPRPRRIGEPGEVEDVPSRDLPADRPRS